MDRQISHQLKALPPSLVASVWVGSSWACRPQILARITLGSPRLLQGGLCPAAEAATGPSQPHPHQNGQSHLLPPWVLLTRWDPWHAAWGCRDMACPTTALLGPSCSVTGAVPWLAPHLWSLQRQWDSCLLPGHHTCACLTHCANYQWGLISIIKMGQVTRYYKWLLKLVQFLNLCCGQFYIICN